MLEWGQTPFTLCLKALCQFERVFEWGVNLAFERRTCFVCMRAMVRFDFACGYVTMRCK